MGWVNVGILASGARASRTGADKQGAWTNQAARRLQTLRILTDVGNERGDIHQRLHVRCVVRHRGGIRDDNAAVRVADQNQRSTQCIQHAGRVRRIRDGSAQWISWRNYWIAVPL